MARTLKTYVTQIGFFDLAIAAPSMKAALDAWGANQNLFHQGLAEESDDPAIITATTGKPGVVLRRAVGTNGEFKEHAEPPKSLPAEAPARSRVKSTQKRAKAKSPPKANKEATHAQVISFEKAQAARAREREKQEAKRVKQETADAREAEKRGRAIEKAQAAIDSAQKRHDDVNG